MLKVRVGHGENLATFTVHQAILRLRSEFFKCATGSVWQQDHDEHMVTLPDDDPEIFRLYINLVYAGRLVTRGSDEWKKLCRLYVLAEKLQDLTARNAIIDGMHAFFSELVSKSALLFDIEGPIPSESSKELYEGTPERSQARKLLVDLYAEFGKESWFRASKIVLPYGLIRDVAVRLVQARGSDILGSWINRPSSYYHEVEVPGNSTTPAVVRTPKRTKTASGCEEAEKSPAKAGQTMTK
ncbi:hypothetical protein BDW02DRAFT_568098 [Decorospora gaudefroyi]|uniref:BTB domain-containing protein n=1 Tax=Decorospora gaudefroyi TaxID=184978 RepID=A0A6A5KGT5_9PLEO|nr:hypothetical protein BDW02DRAFT_568098 [Decorospora gaudefroyi]